MQIFLYEWVTGGGMLGYPGAIPEPLLVEGTAMIQAVAEGFLQLPDARVSLLQDLRVGQIFAPGAEKRVVGSRSEHDEEFQRLCRQSDAVLLIAPEFDGELLKVVDQAESCGARLISPDRRFVAIAGDKHATCERLLAAGAPTLAGIVLPAEGSLPTTFNYPAVVKPIDGAGSQDTWVVNGAAESPPAGVGPRRLEPYRHGIAASVAVLLGGPAPIVLPPCKQRLSSDGRLRYQGGELPLRAGFAARAERLALAAVAALPPTRGYVGIDIILGDAPTGDDDVVIEVNPRLTTSYAAVRFAIEENLAAIMLDASRGKQVTVTPKPEPLEFGADGAVSYLEK